MGKNKKNTDYRSYQYLEAGVDYKAFKLAPELSRVPQYVVPITEEQETRVQKLLDNSVIISLHDHPTLFPANMEEIFEYNRQGRESTAYKGLSASCLDAVFDNMMDGTCLITSKHGWKWSDVLYDLGMRLSDIAHQDFIIPCKGVADILTAHNEGKLALVPALESATMIENEVDRIDILYGFGVRMMGIVYSESNALGTGLREERDGGLTSFGREAVRRMNQLGMAIDTSHASDRTTLDVIEASTEPVFVTHTGARALWNTRRLKPDVVLKACAEAGGCIGIEAAPHTTLTKKHPKHSIDSYMEHFQYCVDLVGIDAVGFGPDTLFGDHVALHHAFSQLLSIQQAIRQDGKESITFDEVEYVKGLENPADFANILRWMVNAGYSDEEIQKAVGGNALRLLKEVWID